MRLIRTATIAALLFAAAAAQAGAGEQTRYLDLVNRAHDSVTSLAIAPAGTDAWQDKPLGKPLQGGGDAATVEVAGQACLYDVRLLFRNGRALIYKDVDMCSGGKLSIRPLPAKETQVRYADRQSP